MFAILDQTLDRVARKMPYSGNRAYIPMLLEFLRFQVLREAIIDMAFCLFRLMDNVPTFPTSIQGLRTTNTWGSLRLGKGSGNSKSPMRIHVV